MKQINKNKLCYTCLGCGKLELESFYGVYHCEHYINGYKENRKEQKKNANK